MSQTSRRASTTFWLWIVIGWAFDVHPPGGKDSSSSTRALRSITNPHVVEWGLGAVVSQRHSSNRSRYFSPFCFRLWKNRSHSCRIVLALVPVASPARSERYGQVARTSVDPIAFRDFICRVIGFSAISFFFFFFFFFQFRARNGANEFDNEIDDGLKRAGRKVSHIDCQLDGVLEWRAPDRFNLSLSLPSFSPFVQRSWWLYSLSPPQYCARGLSARKKEKKKGNKKTDQAIQRVELKSGTTTSSTYSLPPHYSHHLLRPKCCSVSVCGGGDVTECVRAPSMRDAIHSITVDPNATSIYEMRLCLLSTTPCDIIPKSLRVLSLHSQLAPSCDYLFVHLTKGRKRKKKY